MVRGSELLKTRVSELEGFVLAVGVVLGQVVSGHFPDNSEFFSEFRVFSDTQPV